MAHYCLGLTLKFLLYKILENFMLNEFRISRENALCFAKFREKATSTRPYPPPPHPCDSFMAILRSAEWRVGGALVVSGW